ncbi:hypothetical protein PVAP13_6NG319801 [Panicum virgatum]|uniref:Uncharacterized protein n=1 Tax=Panicum virgatum TaxID=38727 RepID=A0A8T0R4C5_PANVG|nr:hypothetical protein PVAP13_6NG319801 [Panicum virgatum]
MGACMRTLASPAHGGIRCRRGAPCASASRLASSPNAPPEEETQRNAQVRRRSGGWVRPAGAVRGPGAGSVPAPLGSWLHEEQEQLIITAAQPPGGLRRRPVPLPSCRRSIQPVAFSPAPHRRSNTSRWVDSWAVSSLSVTRPSLSSALRPPTAPV